MKLDPRTKLFLLFTVTTLMLSTSIEGNLLYIKPILSFLPFLLLIQINQKKTALKYLILYILCFGLEWMALHWMKGMSSFLVMALTSIMTRFAPGIMVAAYLIESTTVSEFVASMQRMHVSETIIIPLSVIFRFIPTMKEEYEAIRDAMRMRDIRFGANPWLMIEYRVVPFIISIVKIGDELSAAALTRGLGAPIKRTNICEIGFHLMDYICFFLCLLAFGFYWMGRILG